MIVGVAHGDSLRLHSDTSISLDFEFVQKLVLVSYRDGTGNLENSVSESALSVVDMRDNTEISYKIG